METASNSQHPSEVKHCWVCFGTDEEIEGIKDWVAPCKCQGSTRWVHKICVQRWIDEKLRENSFINAQCPQCNTDYIFIYNEVNYFVRVLDKLDKTTNYFSHFLAAGVAISTIYWSAVSYGAITMIQVMGKQEAIIMMEKSDPYLLLLLLPSIPLGLILGKKIHWEETFLLSIQRLTLQLPLLRIIMPSFLCEPIYRTNSSIQLNSFINPITTLCAALLLPTTASIVGKLIFNNSSYSNFHKTLLGGLLYIAGKGALRIYQSQHNATQMRSRKIIDYPNIEENQ